MPTVTMPQLGESVTEGTILQWYKKPGDTVALDDPLCEVETEKVTADLPSPYEGTMGDILVPEGETVEVGAPLCEIAGEGQAEAGVSAVAEPQPVVSTASGGWSGGPMAIPPDEDAPREEAPAPPTPQRSANGHSRRATQPDDRARFHSPAVLRLAREHSVDLGAVPGSGAGGRVTRKDVEQWLAAGAGTPAGKGDGKVAATADAGAAYEVVNLTPTRRTIAEHLKRSNLEAPQAWTMVEADVTGLVALRGRERERYQQQEGVDLTLLPYFVAAVCETLREFPMLNARWEGEELRRYRALNIGIAVAAERGLVVPVVHNAGDLSVAGLAKAIADLVQRAHARKLRLEDIEAGTFTVNNTGSFGSIASKPIVNYPEVGIVTMERVVKRPVVVEGDAIAVRSMVNVCLSFDHRVLDGLEAGGFMAALKERLEGLG